MAQECVGGEQEEHTQKRSRAVKLAMEAVGESAQRKAAMVNDPDCSDVQFVTQDGHRIWANRGLLAHASPVFCAMLTNGITLDSVSSSVPLPSIPSAALLPVLEFLYTGSPCLSRYPLSISSAPLVLDAARFLLLPEFQLSVASFFADCILSLISLNLISPSDATFYLSQTLDMSVPSTHDALSKLTALIPHDLTLDPETIARFSTEALAFFLDKTRNGSLRFDDSEYNRLRGVLLWCAASVGSLKLTELFCNSLHLQEGQAPSLKDRAAWTTELKLSGDKVRKALESWLPRLDLFRIRSDILTELLLPLNIIPPTYLVHVLAFQAHFSVDMIYLRWKRPSTSDTAKPMQISVFDEDHCIKCSLNGDNLTRSFSRLRPPGCMASVLCMPPRFAVAEMPVTQAMGSHEWEFVIEKECAFMAVGFCSGQALSFDQDHGSWLGYQTFGWVLCHTGRLFHNSKMGTSYGAGFTAGSVVRVHVDMIELTCSFTVNETVYGIAWKNIPHEIYPAAALTFPGQIRIQAVSNEHKAKLAKCLSEFTSLT